MMYSRTDKGFTLVELMVVIAIVAILAAIAYPSYLQWTKKKVRTQGAIYLKYLAHEAQDYLIVHRAYPTSWAAFETGFYDGEGYGDTSARQTVSKHYAWPPTVWAHNVGRFGNDGPPRFLITLTPTSKLMEDDTQLCIDNIGGVMANCDTTPIPWDQY